MTKPDAPKKPQTQDYLVLANGTVAGVRRKKGETVKLTEAQAKYENVTLKSDAKEEGKTPKK